MIEQAEHEANLSLFKLKIGAQLNVPLNELRAAVPQDPQCGVKINSEDKNVFWYGYKAHLAVEAKSQSNLHPLFLSESLNDGKAAIPLLKGVHEGLAIPSIRYGIMDAGYDYEPIYEQIHRLGLQSVIVYNKRNESEPEGSINISPPHVSGSIPISMTAFTPSMKLLNTHVQKNVRIAR